MRKVKVVHWNPRRKKNIFGYYFSLPFGPKVNNFGDLIGPLIVQEVLKNKKMSGFSNNKNTRLLTVGSILHFAKDNDVVWGAGKNGKVPEEKHKFKMLDVRAVRGPLTRDFLRSKGIECPENYGDPGLLFSSFFPRYTEDIDKEQHDITIIPNLNDFCEYSKSENVINPTNNIGHIIKRIANSNFVVGSSLHAIVIAESFGVPARLIKSKFEHHYKYEDYYFGSFRNSFKIANSVSQAIDLGGEKPPNKQRVYESLLNSFPLDLWLD